jgi:threonine/homoserine efflux transporter RhtA
MNRPAGPVPWLAYGALALSTSLVGTYVGLSKLLVLVFPVFLLAWLRFGMAAVIMLPWLKPGANEPRLSPREPGPRLLVTGAVHGNETCGTRAITQLLEEIDGGQLASSAAP